MVIFFKFVKSELIGAQQQQQELQQQQQQQQELSKQREDDYLVRKYKYNRRFAPYNANSSANSNNAANGAQQNFNNSNAMSDNMGQLENTSTNLYLLASSRHHHRLNHSSNEGMNGEGNANGANISSKNIKNFFWFKRFTNKFPVLS